MATIQEAKRLDIAKSVGERLSFEGTVRQGSSLVDISAWGLILRGHYADDAPAAAPRVSLAVGSGITLGTTGKFAVSLPTAGLTPGKVLEWAVTAAGDADAPVVVKGSLALQEAAG
jgi:hypothetical protein